MGSKRASSNKPTNVSSSPPPTDPSADGNHQNSESPSTAPPKSHKKPKLSAPISKDSSFVSHDPSPDGEVRSRNRNRKGKLLGVSSDISHGDGAAPRPGLFLRGETEKLKLLEAVVAYRAKTGYTPRASNMTEFFSDIKDWAPAQLTEKNLVNKLRHFRFIFQRNPKPGPESSEFDRRFYELASEAWNPENLKLNRGKKAGDSAKKKDTGMERKGNASGKKEKVSKKQKVEKTNEVGVKEDGDGVEAVEGDSETDEGTKEMAKKRLILDNAEEVKDKLHADGDNGLLKATKEAGHSYRYLKLALEEYWTEFKLNTATLHAALTKVDPIKAKQLDEQFHEVFVEMLKLKMEKNKASNEIIHVCLGC